METQTNGKITNRGQLLAMLGATRADDGSYRLREPCPDCQAEAMRIDWDRANGIEGTIRHIGDGDLDGCTMTTAEVVPIERMPAPPPVSPPPGVPLAPKKPLVAADRIQFVQFVHPVSGGDQGDVAFWSRNKHGGKISLAIEPPFVVLSWPIARPTEVRKIPLQNVAFIAERNEG